MGTLGQYLSSARELKGFDLHDAAQQTRISIQYLKALEQEDFAKLPGEVFVRGFLKNYAKFLGIPEQEVLAKYGELRHAATGPIAAVPQPVAVEQASAQQAREKPSKISLEPWLWGAVIFISILGFLFMATPEKQQDSSVVSLETHTAALHSEMTASAPPAKPEKLYLQIVALEDVWLLVRTDSGPQKKAVLKKDENVVWSADERFLLSFGSIGAIKLLLNGEELQVNGTKNTVVRDLAITASGITNPKIIQALPKQPKPRPKALSQPAPTEQPTPTTQPPAIPQPEAPVAPPQDSMPVQLTPPG